jgi:hypothetical protein
MKYRVETKTIIVDGVEMEAPVKILPKSKKRAASIQKARYQKGGRGAWWLRNRDDGEDDEQE